MQTRKCPVCGILFIPPKPQSRYCLDCRDKGLRYPVGKHLTTLTERTCLKCGNTFLSGGTLNRLCEACNRSNRRLSARERMERG